MVCDFLPPPAHACFPPFEQFIGQQMVQLQDSISEHLHHHTLSNMLSDGTSKAHRARILSCSGPRASVWFVARPIFSTFQLSSPVFHTQFGLPHPSIIGIFWCVCTHPIELMDIHLLCCAHGNEHTKTHDAIYNTFTTIAWNVGFHVR